MIQDTTPYGSYQALMGGGPGAAANMGVGVGAATGAMAQTLADRATQDQSLNVTAQDVQNQQAQEALKQAQLATSVQGPQAAQAIQAAQQATASAAATGPQVLSSTAGATIAKNYAGMAESDRAKHDTQMRDWQDAKALKDSKGFDWNNPDHTEMLHRELSKSGMQDIPSTLGPKDGPMIDAGATMATNSLEISRQMQLGQSQHGFAMELETLKGKTAMSVAELQGQVGIYKMLAGLPDTSRAVLLARKEAFENGGTVSPETMAQATAAIRAQVLGQPDIMQAIQAHETQNFQTETGKEMKLVVADAKQAGLPADLITRLEKAGDKEELAKNIARKQSTAEKEELVSTQVKARLPFHTDTTGSVGNTPTQAAATNTQTAGPMPTSNAAAGVTGAQADQLMAVYKQNPKNKGFTDQQLLQAAQKAGKISPQYTPGP